MVLNMADSKSGLSVQDVEATIGAPVDVSIPRSKAVAFSTNRGIPVLQDGRKDPAVKGLQAARGPVRSRPGAPRRRRNCTAGWWSK